MIRTLVVLRHAKSDWPHGVADHERPLTGRGRRDAAAVGRWLRGRGLTPDLVLCSPSRRTRQTWELAGAELGSAPSVQVDERVYAAEVAELLTVVRETPDDVATVLLVGHNPGAEGLAETLAGGGDGEALRRMEHKFPTSGVAVLSVPVSWADLGPGSAKLTEFAVPRG
jgi:phosphohistidine phosphatase